MFLLACSTAQAAVVTVGDHFLLANMPNQTITIPITGTEQVAGEDFFAQIGDGGTFNNGSNTRPVFSSVDIINGTIFAADNVGAQGDPGGTPPGSNAGHPLIWVDGTVTAGGTVPASGVLATLRIDTTGLNSGTFPLELTGVANSLGGFNTTLRNDNGDPIPLTVNNGSIIVVVPEPGAGVLLGLVGLAALVRRGRRDRRRTRRCLPSLAGPGIPNCPPEREIH
jgi:hypothetical protein